MTSDASTKGPVVIFRCPGAKLALYTICLPIFAFLACIILSVVYNFEGATATHCGVRNYLPSISSAIGGYTPQRYIWRICIALHSAPRFMLAIMYWNYYNSFHVTNKAGLYYALVPLACTLHIVENAALILLTNVASVENYNIHEKSFIVFMASAIAYMILSCILYKWARLGTYMSPKESWSLTLKVRLLLFNIAACIAAVYFFLRHNSHCEPGVYTFFAICEYLIVLSNIAFHACATYDFGDGALLYSLLPPNQESAKKYSLHPFRSV